MACGFDNPKVNLHIADGSIFIKNRQKYYDVIIVDSSDPIGPGEALFEPPFYKAMKTSLKPDGIIATQAESFFLHRKTVKNLMKICHGLFKHAKYAFIMVPTYPGGNIGICVASDTNSPEKPTRTIPKKIQAKLRYYNKNVHIGSFMLPENGIKIARDNQ